MASVNLSIPDQLQAMRARNYAKLQQAGAATYFDHMEKTILQGTELNQIIDAIAFYSLSMVRKGNRAVAMRDETIAKISEFKDYGAWIEKIKALVTKILNVKSPPDLKAELNALNPHTEKLVAPLFPQPVQKGPANYGPHIDALLGDYNISGF